MKIKKYKNECLYALFPFGSGCPVCIYDRVDQKNHSLPIKPCKEKGCEHKKVFTSIPDEIKGRKN